jgi:hypothetical protein
VNRVVDHGEWISIHELPGLHIDEDVDGRPCRYPVWEQTEDGRSHIRGIDRMGRTGPMSGQSQQHSLLQQAQVFVRQHSAFLQSHLQDFVLIRSPHWFRFCRQVLSTDSRRTFCSANTFAVARASRRSPRPLGRGPSSVERRLTGRRYSSRTDTSHSVVSDTHTACTPGRVG